MNQVARPAGAEQATWPIRSFWSWPLGTMLVAGSDALTQSTRLGWHLPSLLLALAAGFAVGVVPGALFAAGAAIVQRRVSISLDVPERWMPSIAVGLLAGALGVALGWPAIASVLGVSEQHPIDYPQTAARLWRGGLALVLPAAVILVYLLMRMLERKLEQGDRAPRLAKIALAGLVVITLAHFSSGPFFIYFGAPVALALVAASVVAAAVWLPTSVPATTMRRLGLIVAPILLAAVGVFGLGHVGARALLLHDTFVFPHVLGLTTAWADLDGDDDPPRWLGGGDCQNGDPNIAAWRVELPRNGLDDNCALGDYVDEPAAAAAPSEQGPRPPIFLITIDTVRTDHLELFGYARQTMPALTKLATTGRWFERAYAPGNHTFFAITSLLAGQSIERMIVQQEAGLPLLKYTFWLPDALRRLGYSTVAVNPPLVHAGMLRAEDLRFDHIEIGTFDYAGKNRGTTAKQVVDTVLRMLEELRADKPVFMWIHFIDPHAAHEAPVRFPLESTLDAYDNELSWVDMHLGRVLRAIEQRYQDEAIVVITADHGEELGERGSFGHGFTLAETEVHVPLAMRGPGITRGRVAEPVSTLGVPATVLSLLAQPHDPRLSHTALLEPSGEPVVAANPAFLWNQARMEAALIEDRYKLVLSRTTNTMLLFDLESDPMERRNLAPIDSERAQAMRAELLEILESRR